MHRLTRLLAGTAIAAAAFTAGLWVSTTRAQQDAPAAARTQYEGLALATPVEAVMTFVDRFEHGDYPALFLILSPEAQADWRRRPVATFDYSTWFTDADLLDQVAMLNSDLPDEHDSSVITSIFDEVMLVAEANDAFVIDLRGAHDLGEPELGPDGTTAQVEARLADGTPVTFALTLSPSGRWRVRQVIVPGGDTDVLPWSAVYQ